MRITTVQFSHLKSLPEWSNRTIGAFAQVADDEPPEDALGHLQNWVMAQHAEADGVSKVRSDIEHLGYEIKRLTDYRDGLKGDAARYAAAVKANGAVAKLAKDHGIQFELPDELPF